MEYKDETWLRQRYINDNLTLDEMSVISGVPRRTLHSWLIKFSIPRRKSGVEHWSEEQKQLRRDWAKAHPDHKPTLGKKASDETKLRMSLTRRGPNNGNWKEGITATIRAIRRSKEYIKWRNGVLQRDTRACRRCGAIENLEVHHMVSILKEPERIFDVDNGMTLCTSCHKKMREV